MGVYKDVEFAQFIKELEAGSIAHWQEIAEALGVEPDTITRWKDTPEAIDARRKGIAAALEGMQTAGRRDWRMWEARLKMLGINPPQKVEATIDDPRKEILKNYMGGENARKTSGPKD